MSLDQEKTLRKNCSHKKRLKVRSDFERNGSQASFGLRHGFGCSVDGIQRLCFFVCFLVLDSIPLFWLVALRMWFNSFLEALKMLTWCLHSKLDKMGRNGSTKKTGNRQLLHQERSCTLLQTNKISTSLGILRGIFLSYNSETNWNSQTLFVDILFIKRMQLSLLVSVFCNIWQLRFFFVSVMKIF